MRQNRLSRLFNEFASEYEMLSTVSPDGLGAKLGIQFRNLLIQARIVFDERENWYQFGAVLRQLSSADVEGLASRILTSEPMTGLTERFLDDKFVIMGIRDNLVKFKDHEIKNLYMEDVDRVRVYYQSHQDLH